MTSASSSSSQSVQNTPPLELKDDSMDDLYTQIEGHEIWVKQQYSTYQLHIKAFEQCLRQATHLKKMLESKTSPNSNQSSPISSTDMTQQQKDIICAMKNDFLKGILKIQDEIVQNQTINPNEHSTQLKLDKIQENNNLLTVHNRKLVQITEQAKKELHRLSKENERLEKLKLLFLQQQKSMTQNIKELQDLHENKDITIKEKNEENKKMEEEYNKIEEKYNILKESCKQLMINKEKQKSEMQVLIEKIQHLQEIQFKMNEENEKSIGNVNEVHLKMIEKLKENINDLQLNNNKISKELNENLQKNQNLQTMNDQISIELEKKTILLDEQKPIKEQQENDRRSIELEIENAQKVIKSLKKDLFENKKKMHIIVKENLEYISRISDMEVTQASIVTHVECEEEIQKLKNIIGKYESKEEIETDDDSVQSVGHSFVQNAEINDDVIISDSVKQLMNDTLLLINGNSTVVSGISIGTQIDFMDEENESSLDLETFVKLNLRLQPMERLINDIVRHWEYNSLVFIHDTQNDEMKENNMGYGIHISNDDQRLKKQMNILEDVRSIIAQMKSEHKVNENEFEQEFFLFVVELLAEKFLLFNYFAVIHNKKSRFLSQVMKEADEKSNSLRMHLMRKSEEMEMHLKVKQKMFDEVTNVQQQLQNLIQEYQVVVRELERMRVRDRGDSMDSSSPSI